MRTSLEQKAGIAAILALLVVAYSNHFDNSFHFDDAHTIENNLYVRSLSNIPRFFSDASTFSNLPTHQVYRPVLTASFAFDYVRGGGAARPFHVTTFVCYVLLLGILFVFYRALLGSGWAGLLAAAVFGLHPVSAETVNYIVQRGDLLSTMGVAGGLALYVLRPGWRRYGLYLIPVALAILVKPPALVFPVLLAAWCWVIEKRSGGEVLRAATPALVLSAVMGWWLSAMTAATFQAGAISAELYRLTQPLVAMHYFSSFFAPVSLSADSDWQVVKGISDVRAITGLAFLAAMAALIVWMRRRDALRPAAFGLIWFFVALAPTSWMPLGEIANDHRMFFAFVGLAPAVLCVLQVALGQWRDQRAWQVGLAVAAGLVLCIEARATYLRNEVWRNEETLWRDVTRQSPQNGRGWMNYGLTQMARADYNGALASFERARKLLPNYFLLEINLGILMGQLGRHTEAEFYFRRAEQLEPARYEPQFFYARWMHGRGRTEEARQRLETALRFNPNTLDARHLLMRISFERQDWQRLDTLIGETLRFNPGDPLSMQYAEIRKRGEGQKASLTAAQPRTPEDFLNLSLEQYRAGRFEECIESARKALALRPGYAEAYNNIAAAYNSMGKWDEGIAAAEEALRVNPAYELARNNREWAISQKRLKKGRR